MRRGWSIAASALLLSALVSGSVKANTDGIAAIKFTQVPCEFKNCDAPDHHGKVQITFADGTKQDIPGDRVFHMDASDAPQIASDHQTAGWLQGEHLDIKRNNSLLYFLPTRLIIYRDHHVIQRLTGELGFIEAWQFWNGGKQVAFRTRAFHGSSYIELYDVNSGNRLAKILGYKVKASSPQWAQKLKD